MTFSFVVFTENIKSQSSDWLFLFLHSRYHRMFLRFKRDMLRASWSIKAGGIINTTGNERYWEKFVKKGWAEEVSLDDAQEPDKIVTNHGRRIIKRPNNRFLTSVFTTTPITLDLPEEGSFNPGLTAYKNGYLLVYRPDEYHFIGCTLDKNFKATGFFPFTKLGMCADPRLIWHGKRLLMVYSSFTDDVTREAIRGAYIFEDGWIDAKPFQISPNSLKTRQKNWTPFEYEGNIFLVQSTCPHTIYELVGTEAVKRYTTNYVSPWFYERNFLRGNTNIVKLEDGRYLGTFHTAERLGNCHFYDNGCYFFEDKPPFKVLKCSRFTYLPAESANQKYFRKHNVIKVCFPTGMVREGNKLLISMGVNDSICKIMTTTVEAMEETTVEVYHYVTPIQPERKLIKLL